MCTFIPILSSLGDITRLVYLQMHGFSSFPQFCLLKVLVGTMGNTSPIWFKWGLGHFSGGCYSLLLDFVHLCVGPWPGFWTSTQGLEDTLLHRSTFWVRIFVSFSPTLFLWGESDWTDVTLRCVLTSPTFTSLLDLLHTFPNADIHLWFLSQRHSSRCCVLHLDTWGPLFTIS